MEEQMSLDEYTALLKECLMRKGWTSGDADEKIKIYEGSLPRYMEMNLSPEEMATLMDMNF